MTARWHEDWGGSRVTCDDCGRTAFFNKPVMRWLISGSDPLKAAGWTWRRGGPEGYLHSCQECAKKDKAA